MMKSPASFPAVVHEYASKASNNPLYRSIFVPSFFVSIMLCGTILLASSFHLDHEVSFAGVLLVMLSCVVFPPVYYNALKIRSGKDRPGAVGNVVRAATVIILAIALAGVLCMRMHDMLADTDMDPGKERWIARVESIIEKRYYLEAEIAFWSSGDGGTPGIVPHTVYRGLVRVTGGDFGQGNVISFSAGPRNISTHGSDRPSVNRSLLLRGIRHVFYLNGGSVRVVKAGASRRERARKALAAHCDRLFNRNTSAMVKALYFGNQDYIAKTTMNDFKRAGVFHILSAGGLHVGIAFLLSPPAISILKSASTSNPYNLKLFKTAHSSRYS